MEKIKYLSSKRRKGMNLPWGRTPAIKSRRSVNLIDICLWIL